MSENGSASGPVYIWLLLWLLLGVGGSFIIKDNNWAAIIFWFASSALLLLMTLWAGKRITGYFWTGAFIDARNRVSLSRFQMISWTILFVSSVYTILIWNINNTSESDITHIFDIVIPETLWALMGISVTTLAASPLILISKESSGSGGNGPAKILHKNKNASEASFFDLIAGEDSEQRQRLDVSRLQMLFLTVVSIFGYTLLVLSQLRVATGEISALPEFSSGLVTILGISHAGYLAFKAIKQPAPESD